MYRTWYVPVLLVSNRLNRKSKEKVPSQPRLITHFAIYCSRLGWYLNRRAVEQDTVGSRLMNAALPSGCAPTAVTTMVLLAASVHAASPFVRYASGNFQTLRRKSCTRIILTGRIVWVFDILLLCTTPTTGEADQRHKKKTLENVT